MATKSIIDQIVDLRKKSWTLKKIGKKFQLSITDVIHLLLQHERHTGHLY